MSEFEGRRGRPNQELTYQRSEKAEWQRSFDQPHDKLVAAFRSYIQFERQAPQEVYGGKSINEEFADRGFDPFTPEQIIHDRLSYECRSVFSVKEVDKLRGEFFSPVKKAWDIIAYKRYDATQQHLAASGLSFIYQRAEAIKRPNPGTIRLSHSLQVRILDALADACELPHQKGKSEFLIPEELRDYGGQISFSQEDIQRAKRYEQEREKRLRKR
jgi:hypothetical protein